MTTGQDLCALALRDPAAAAQWSTADWNRFTPQARSAGLLGRATARVATESPHAVPAGLLGHLQSSQRMGAAQRAEILRELGHLRRALAGISAPVVLLKGAAYLAADLPAAGNRFFSDIDILVPKAALGAVESCLMLNGWLTTHHNDYDQRYYREWMHELPPMQHVHRGTTIDVHHTIAPESGRLKPDVAALLAASRPLPAHPGFHVLSPADMVLHSMTHLFLNDDMSHGLRDLSDLDLLIRHFESHEPDFWSVLVARATTLGLGRPLHYGLKYCESVLGTPVPAGASAAMRPLGPPAPLRRLMDALWRRALASPNPSATLRGHALALFALYVRGHWLRMPPLLLAKHLTTKALRLHERGAATPAQPDPAPERSLLRPSGPDRSPK